MIEWRTIALIGAAHGLWLVAGLSWQLEFGVLALPVLAVVAAFHTSLQHETIHGHPTSLPWLNETLVSLPLAIAFPYRRYRDLHLKHHHDAHLTDPYEDPESYFWPLRTFRTMRPVMRYVFAFNNTLVGRLIVGPLLSLIGFCKTEIPRLLKGEPGIRLAWGLHLGGLIIVALIVSLVFAMPLWLYGLCVVYPALSIVSLRSYAEHQAAENLGERSAVVESCSALGLLYLNNNLHIVHHASPSTAWYDLPSLYRERRDQYLAANGSYLFRGYFEIARLFAFRSKQSVDHPFLHREIEPAE